MYCDKIVIQALGLYIEDYSAHGIAAGVSRAIRDGTLPPGTRLPSIRATAEQFQCSPTTVSGAWAKLRRAGLIHADRRRGTVVIEPVPAGRGRYRKTLGHTADLRLDLSTGTPDRALLPDLARCLPKLSTDDASGSYLGEPVVPDLLQCLRDSWPWPSASLTVADGAMDAVDLVVATHLRFGDRAAVEDPCFPPLLDLLSAAGITAVPMGVDTSGVLPDSLANALHQGARAVFLQPRAQNPAGFTMSTQRRDELAGLLAGTGTLVLEVDSSGLVGTTALESIGTRLPAQTIHVRSYSKSHGPDLRLSAIGGPPELIDPLVSRRYLGQGWTSHLLQRLLLSLLTDSSAIGTVERARETYGRRRELLISALGAESVDIRAADGLNLWVPVEDEAAALISLTQNGIGVAPGSLFRSSPGGDPHVRVTFAALATGQEDVARALVRAGAH